jgi:predicted dinucleotide-binding enzyme
VKVGILGSGDVAQSLGTGFATLGHDVKLGTRDPKSGKLDAWKKRVGAKGSVGTFAETAEFGEILVLATLGVANRDAVRSAGPERFAGKILIDVTNPLDFSKGMPPSLAVGHTESAAEQVQRELPKTHVVKSFNIIGHTLMFRPNLPGGPPDMWICGNDAKAKQRVTQILHDFGWPSVIDLGGLDGARLLEPLCVLWVRSALALGNWETGFKLLRK